MQARFIALLLAGSLISCSPEPPLEPPGERIATRRDAIIAGSESTTDQDYVVLLYRPANNQTCTATMVAPNLLVTARHCVSDVSKSGRAVDGAPGGKQIVVDGSSMYPDVAFVVLAKSLSTPVATMRLDPGVTVGESLDVIGYGIDETGTRPVRRMQRSGLEVYAVGPGRSQIGEPLARGEIVFGEAACSGDSGGPAFSTETGELVAIASRVGNGTAPNDADPAAFCVGEKADDVYTDFTPVRDLAARAFAIADGRELATAPIVGADPAAPNEAGSGSGDGGCAMSTKRTSPSMALLGIFAVVLLVLDRRRPSRPRS
jgi:hypothetical protein